jgi:hypothetical protein
MKNAKGEQRAAKKIPTNWAESTEIPHNAKLSAIE